jgi:hypothetical protein
MTPPQDPPGGVPIEAGVITVLAGQVNEAREVRRATKRSKNGFERPSRGKAGLLLLQQGSSAILSTVLSLGTIPHSLL